MHRARLASLTACLYAACSTDDAPARHADASADVTVDDDAAVQDADTSPAEDAALDGGIDAHTSERDGEAPVDDANVAPDAQPDDDPNLPAANDADGCVASDLGAVPVPSSAPVLIVGDRSGSMLVLNAYDCHNGFDQFDATSYTCVAVDCNDPQHTPRANCGYDINRWDPARAAMVQLATEIGDALPVGLWLYPGNIASPEQCGVGTNVVPSTRSAGPAIASALATITPRGASPLWSTLEAIRERIAAGEPTPAALVLLTDGDPNCGANGNGDLPRVLQQLGEFGTLDIPSYVLAPADTMSPFEHQNLATLAAAGGTGVAYAPATVSQLADQLTRHASTCDYILDTRVDTLSALQVTLDGNPVAAAELAIDAHTLSLQDDACARLRAPGEHSLRVRYTCSP